MELQVDDNSYRYRAIRGDNGLTLYFSLAEYVEIPVGSWCEFQGERYTLLKAEDFIMHHTRNFEYTVSMSSDGARLAWYKLRNPVDRRLKFSYTATPMEHLQMLVDNLNERGSGWSVGTCITSSEKLITYNHTSCLDGLMQMSETFNTEYEIDRRRISLTKVEYNKDNPLPLSYGKGNGFRPGIGRTNYENSIPVAVLYVQGGSRNIDASKYGNAELLLPKNAAIRYDGNKFEDESGFNAGNARSYITDAGGYSISRNGRIADGMEDSLDCSEVYPHRDETIKEVILVDADKHWYDIVTDAPSSLDYSKYGIGGEVPTIVFQSGELSGREFDLETDNDGNIKCEVTTTESGITGWKFQIVPSEIDGITMPGGSFIPKAGDTFRIFGIQLPYEYIADGETKSGASWEMFREGVKYLYSKEDRRFTFTGELDGIWAKKDWLNIGGKIKLGGFISFTDDRFQKDPVLIRITGIKEYINNPYSPEIELSNSTVGGTVANDLNQIESDKAAAEEMFDNSISYTKRRFRDAKETISMLEDAMLKNFTDSISPITVQTMMMLVGDESLQFRFVDSMTSPRPVIHNVTYDIEHKVLKIPEGIIQHMTLGITSVSTKDGHSSSEYKFWSLPAFESPVLDVPEKKYYVYAKVSRTDQVGVFYMSETAISMESESDVYYLLMGLLNSEYEGSRSYVSLYGFTEILPGQVTTDVLRDPDANLVIDLAHALITAKNGARINGNIYIGPGSSGLENLEEWEDKQQALEEAQETADTAQETIAGWIADGVISPLEKQGLKNEVARIKADYEDVQSGYSKYGLGNPTDYNLAYAEYYNVLSEILSSPEQNVPVPDNFDTIQDTYYDRWVDALEAIAAAAKEAVSQAQEDANTAQDTADEALQKANEAKDYIDNTLPEEIAEINKKLDGIVETWFYPYSPTLSNEPAATWIKDGEQEKHIGDLFLNNQEYVDDETTPDAGKAWRWEKNTSGDYFWNQVADSDAVKALQDAAKAQDTADQKRRVFVTTPYTPYDVGDMWTQGPDGDIMRCIKARATGSYTASDWDKASKYTDDTVAQQAKDAADAARSAAQQAKEDAQDAQDRLDDWASDSYISPTEKPAIKDEIARIDADKNQIEDGYLEYGLGTPTSYNDAYNTYRSQLVDLSASSPENISIPSTFRTNQSTYYSLRTDALAAIAAAAKTVVDNINIGVTNIARNGRLSLAGVTTYRLANIYLHKNLTVGQKYTAVLSGVVRGSQRIGIWDSKSSTQMGYFSHKSGRIYQLTFTFNKISTAVNYILNIYNYPSSGAASNPADIDWICIYEGDVTAPNIYMEAPENMLSGGVNLIRNSKLDNMDGWAFNTGGSIVEFGGYTCLKCTGCGEGVYTFDNDDNVPLEGNITNSVDVYATAVCEIGLGKESVAGSGLSLRADQINRWVRIHGTQTLDGKTHGFIVYSFSDNVTIYFKNVQCEQGIYATPWKISPDDIQQRFSDIEYLETVFPNSNLVAGGALIGNMAVVTDKDPKVYDDAKVVAGLNGTTIGSDTTYGKALIFAGSNGVTDSAIKNATTIIYESGRIKSKDVDLEGKITSTSGKIGGFVISDGFTSTIKNDDNTTTSVGITSSAILLNNTGYEDYESTFWAKAYPSSLVGTKDNTYVEISQDRVAASVYGKYVKNVALNISADGASTGFHLTNGTDRPYRFDGNFAIRCPRGMFAGFRPMVRQIPGVAGTTFYDQENYLTIDDCVIICRGTNLSMDIYLPGSTSPSSDYYLQNGQCYQIWNNGSVKRIIHAQGGKRINWSGIQTGTTQTLESNDYRVIHLIYSSQANLWMMYAPPHQL